MKPEEKYELFKSTRFNLLGSLGAFLILSKDSKIQLHNESDYMALKDGEDILVEIKDGLVHDNTWKIDMTPSMRKGVHSLVSTLQVTCSEMDKLVDEMNSRVITEAVNDMFKEGY